MEHPTVCSKDIALHHTLDLREEMQVRSPLMQLKFLIFKFFIPIFLSLFLHFRSFCHFFYIFDVRDAGSIPAHAAKFFNVQLFYSNSFCHFFYIFAIFVNFFTLLPVDCWYFKGSSHSIRLCRVYLPPRRMPKAASTLERGSEWGKARTSKHTDVDVSQRRGKLRLAARRIGWDRMKAICLESELQRECVRHSFWCERHILINLSRSYRQYKIRDWTLIQK